MSGYVILNCTCKSDFQDKKYGKGKRVANLTKTELNAFCTVCGTKLVSGKAALADKKKAEKAAVAEKEIKPKERQKEKAGNKK